MVAKFMPSKRCEDYLDVKMLYSGVKVHYIHESANLENNTTKDHFRKALQLLVSVHSPIPSRNVHVSIL